MTERNTEHTEGHISVLLHEAIDILDLKRGSTFVDATLGNAGHSLEACKRLGADIRIVGIEADAIIAEKSRERLERERCNAQVVVGNFRNLDSILKSLSVQTVDGVLFDLGLNSEELERSGRGFSFLRDEPLLMTFGETEEGIPTAAEIINTYDESALTKILSEYGEERQAKNIARSIIEYRRQKRIISTADLVSAIQRGYRGKYPRRIHFATKTFQALRIAVNDELKALSEGLEKAFAALTPAGRIAVISFHSLEDRIVKEFFKQKVAEGKAAHRTKKPIRPTLAEIEKNRRARSAKLRAIEKI